MSLVPPEQAPLILIADDDGVMRLQLQRALAQDNYRVIEATDGVECLSLYKQLHPDIVLLDAVMPVMDGFTCCSKLHMLSEIPTTPVLMITALEDNQSVDRAFAVGAADYVTKPIHWAVLRQRVRRLLQQVRLYQQLQAANLELQRLASIDGLTGVGNRRHFDERLKQEWYRLAREKLPLSLILCDVDFFKHYNDTYGHSAGDLCLQQVARMMLVAVKRPADLVARYGGEEFVVLLPNTDALGAMQVAEDIRLQVKSLLIVHAASEAGPYLTISSGVSSLVPNSQSTPAMLISAADQALYQAKAAGRDRATLSP